MNERKLVQASLQKIFNLNGYSNPESMTQRDYDHISAEIERKSGIVISGITIKRLSTGAFSRLPQIATLNAIAKYFDFKTWQDYKSSLYQPQKPDVPTKPVIGIPKKDKLRFPAFLKWLPFSLLALLIFSYYMYSKKGSIKNFDKASFSAHKTTSNQIPNTVVFNYNIDDVVADSFFIQQSWDRNRRVRIYKNKHTLSDIYYEPGYHVAKLIANDSILQTVDVHIPTDRWFFYANEIRYHYATEYIKTEKFKKNGSLAITEDELLENGISTDQEKIFLYSYFPSKLEVSCDDFQLKTRIRMKEIRNNLCPYLCFEVYGQRDAVLLKTTSRGCANRGLLRVGEKEINGKETDLSQIAFDVTQWTDVQLSVRDKQVTININGKDAFSTSYSNTLKLITGLSFISNGLCEVDFVQLAGMNGKIVYTDDFNNQ